MLSRFLLVFFTLSSFAYGQSVITVTSAESGAPVPFAAIYYLENGSAIFSTKTDNRGSYTFPAGDFKAQTEVSFMVESDDFESFISSITNQSTQQIALSRSAASLDQFIVTGQLSSRSLDGAVQKARIIDRKTMDAKGAVNLRDVLQSELNIRISQDQVLGSGMSLQGMTGQNVKILIDGVPVIGRVDGEIDLSQINLANIERIEIVEGPSSVSYGSNALAGTINLISKKKERRGQTAQVNSYYETVGNYNLDGRFSTNLKKSQLQVYGQRNYFDGFMPGDPFIEFPQKKIADSARFQSWKPKLQYQAGLKWIVPIKNVTLTPFLDVFYEKIHNKGYPRAPYYNVAFDDYYVTNRFNQGIQIEAPLGDKFRLQGVVAYNNYERIKNTYLLNLNTLDKVLTTVPGDQDTTRFTAFMSRMSFVKNVKESRLNYEIGYDVNHETASGRRILETKQEITEAALFSNAEFQVKKLVVKPGLRATYNSAYRSSLTPALNMKYATEKWNYRIGIASGFRSPAIKELYLDFVDINHNIHGNLNLKPEQSMHYQFWVGTKRAIRKQPFNIDLNGYYQKVSNKITLAQAQDGVTYSYFNLDDFDALGTQATLDYRPGRHQFKLGFAYVGTKSNLTLNGFNFSPEVTATASVFWKGPEITFSAFYKYTGRVQFYQQAEDGTTTMSFMEDYNIMDASASHDFLNELIVVTVGAKNLFNVTGIGVANGAGGAHTGNASSTPISWGRSTYIKLQFNLKSRK